jgi:protein-S-isoprenylcysteine O-methyltransferase Ste14
MWLALPISIAQYAAFVASGLIFFYFLLRAFSRRTPEPGSKRDRRSQAGIVIQTFGIALVGFGPVKLTLGSLSAAGLAGTAGVLLLMSGAIALFATSSRELGRNWSLVARTRSDHELVRTGPYALVRHPIYLGMLLFELALAVALGHWLQLVAAIPLFLIGTRMRTDAEERLLEQSFGDAFRQYRDSTPAIFPKIG